jgi:ribonucleoside-diphosphate reductase alpha chain
MRTSDIQKNVIQHAVQLASASAPIWLNVAGRALAMDHWADFKFRGKSFAEIVQANIKSGIYSKELEQSYSKTDLDILGSVIDMNRDLDHSYASLSTGYKKYISKNELNQHMHMVNAMRFGQYENAESRVQFSSDFYDVLSKRELSLATPFMSNLRKGGNVASCFILAINDDLDSIFDNIKNIAKISKNGGGLGIYLGKLRAKGSSVNGYSNAAGTITRWVKIINDTLVAVNQSFTGDTIINCERGDIRIDAVSVGDRVKTHDGTFRDVLEVKHRISDTPIHEITTSRGVVRVTAMHPVLVVKKNGLSSEELKSKLVKKDIRPIWVSAKDLSAEYLIIRA